MSEKVTETMQHTISQIQPKIIEKKEDKSESPIVIQSMPNWMRISGWCALVIIALACITNIIFGDISKTTITR